MQRINAPRVCAGEPHLRVRAKDVLLTAAPQHPHRRFVALREHEVSIEPLHLVVFRDAQGHWGARFETEDASRVVCHENPGSGPRFQQGMRMTCGAPPP